MADKRSTSGKQFSEEQDALKESFTGGGVYGKGLSAIATGFYSPEAKQRRSRLIAEINEGWSHQSEAALSRIAARYDSKDAA